MKQPLTINLKPYGVCAECGAPLTREESYYYEQRCEDCERAWLERIEAWRHGAEDAYFDQLFGYDNYGSVETN